MGNITNNIVWAVAGIVIGLIGAMLLVKGSLRNRQSQAEANADMKMRVLEEQHSQTLQERDQIILSARTEVNQLMKELATLRQEADARVSAVQQDSGLSSEERAQWEQERREAEAIRQNAAAKDAELAKLTADLMEARVAANNRTGISDQEVERLKAEYGKEAAALRAEVNDLQISLRAAERIHQTALEAKVNECERVIKEKDDSIQRERELLTTQLHEQLEKINSAVTPAPAAPIAEEEKESFGDLLAPVREALERLEKQNQLMERRRDNTFEAIEKGIDQLTSEAVQLANALRKPAQQGAWGEMAITTILENAGLMSGEHFTLHESGSDNKKRTDVVLKLPQGRSLVIDSSVPLDAYWDAQNAASEEAKGIRNKAFARIVREHVKELGAAYYWASYDALPDCVIMFLPTEGAYFSALEADPTLLQQAKDAGVYLANPMTVLNMAHIAAYVLADDRVRQNAQEIKQLGSELYERLRMFSEHFGNVGQNLRTSVDSYNKALSWIDRNVMPTARKMQLLGSQKAGTKPLAPNSPVDKSVRSFQSPDLRELPLELTYEEDIVEETA